MPPFASFCAILDQYALQDGWHRGQPEGVPKQTVAGRVPSILQSILIKNGAKESIRWLVAFPWPSQVWLHHHMQSHGALSHPNPQPNAVGPQQHVWMCEKKLFAGWKVFSLPDFKEALPVRQDNQKKLFRGWRKVFLTVPHSKGKQIASPRRKWIS